MGFRLQLTKGLWINLSKIGGPLSFRRRELTTNISRKGVRKSIGLSGSSLSYQPKLIKLAGAISPFLVQYLAASFGDIPERGNGREAAIRPNRGRLFDGEGLHCFLARVGNVDQGQVPING